jgi:16S rRNA (cytosine967-C5)-methyltransferase
VYATCSLLPQENEHIASAFTQANKEFNPLPAVEILSNLKVDGAAGLCSGGEGGGEYLRLWPHRHRTDGFFAAIWVKI